MDMRKEQTPAEVPQGVMQAGEAEARRERWGWVEPTVWTDRMLAALEKGVKGGKWIRVRFRSILRKRAHLRGRGRGRDHNRWPNAFFLEHGHFSLYDAYVKARQSVTR